MMLAAFKAVPPKTLVKRYNQLAYACLAVLLAVYLAAIYVQTQSFSRNQSARGASLDR